MTFVENGFHSWKKALESFKKHDQSECHSDALSKLSKTPTVKDVGELISVKHANEKKDNRHMLIKIADCLRYLATQEIPMRGKTDETSNLITLLKLRAKDDPRINNWLIRSKKNLCHADQNELLKYMAFAIVRKKAEQIRASKFIGILADESADISQVEQLIICIRWIDHEKLTVFEEFLELCMLENTKADHILQVIKLFFTRLNLELAKTRSQNYDGAK